MEKNKNMRNMRIKIEEVTRVEGHGNIHVDITEGKVEKVLWEVPESARFFEAMLKGKPYNVTADIVSRICGICSIGHYLASLKATEDAFGIKPSKQTLIFRKLLTNAETIQSHILHVGYLIVPDLLGVNSVVPLVSAHTEAVKTIIRLHKLGNDMSEIIGGRTTHPVRATVGGFTKLPSEKELEKLKKYLTDRVEDLKTIAGVLKTLKIPDFQRETEYIALKNADEYAFYDGDIASTDDGIYSKKEYLEVTNEFCVPHSTAKHTKHNRNSYMVGALARFNNNYEQLHPLAKSVAGILELRAPCHNTYMNTIAQVVETVHATEDSLLLISQILSDGINEESVKDVYDRAKKAVKAGTGIGIVDVPRGTLIHNYEYNIDGKITKANCIIPTNMNHANIQKDMEKLVPELVARNKTEEEITLALEMLVRAYDPCISCSTHEMKLVDVKFS